jgi:NitT/TauT family transport system substrate-binding protein
MKNIFLVLTVVSALCGVTACNSKQAAAGGGHAVQKELRIARQFSITYAPVYIMEKKNLLQKYIPDTKIEWLELGTPALIIESLAANRLDVACGGVPPAIIAWDKGVDLRILSNLCNAPMGLQVKSSISGLRDFGVSDKIAIPGPGANQHISLSMVCENVFGDAHALDTALVTMSHPDGAIAMINGSIAGHFTSLPYLAQENNAGFKTILTGVEAFGGDYATIICYSSKKLLDENPPAAAGVIAGLSEAMNLINRRDPEVIKIIAEVEKISEQEALAYLDWQDTNYTTTLYGVEGFADFMYREGYISRKPALEEILWEPALAAIGKRSGEPGILEKAQQRGQ